MEDSNWAATGRPRAPPLTTQVPVTGDSGSGDTVMGPAGAGRGQGNGGGGEDRKSPEMNGNSPFSGPGWEALQEGGGEAGRAHDN